MGTTGQPTSSPSTAAGTTVTIASPTSPSSVNDDDESCDDYHNRSGDQNNDNNDDDHNNNDVDVNDISNDSGDTPTIDTTPATSLATPSATTMTAVGAGTAASASAVVDTKTSTEMSVADDARDEIEVHLCLPSKPNSPSAVQIRRLVSSRASSLLDGQEEEEEEEEDEDDDEEPGLEVITDDDEEEDDNDNDNNNSDTDNDGENSSSSNHHENGDDHNTRSTSGFASGKQRSVVFDQKSFGGSTTSSSTSSSASLSPNTEDQLEVSQKSGIDSSEKSGLSGGLTGDAIDGKNETIGSETEQFNPGNSDRNDPDLLPEQVCTQPNDGNNNDTDETAVVAAQPDQPQSPLARITEGMATYLCPASIEEEDVQTEYRLAQRHRRDPSETDSLQKVISAGACGSVPCGAGEQKSEQERMIDDGAPCTDLGLLELRQVVALDVSAVLGSTSGGADSWFTSLHSWMNSLQTGSTSVKTKLRIRNASGSRRRQTRKLQHLWYQWHSRNANEPQNFELSNPHTLGRPVWVVGAKSFDEAAAEETRSERRSEMTEDGADLCYDSDPEVFRRARYIESKQRMGGNGNLGDTTSSSSSNNNNNNIRASMPHAIDTQASYSTTGAGPLPAAPRHIHGKGAPSFDTQFTQSFDTQSSADSEDSRHRVEVVGLNLKDDTNVKTFVKVS